MSDKTRTKQIERIVTPEQLAEGYVVLNGLLAERHRWSVIRRLDDGNYLVHDPDADAANPEPADAALKEDQPDVDD